MSYHRILSTAVVAALALSVSACGQEKQSDPCTQAPLVRTVTLTDSANVTRAFTGVVAARVTSDLGFRVSGKVLARRVDSGQTVRKGQLLMRLDPADLMLTAHAQQAAVIAAQAQAKQAAQEEARYRRLRGTGAISASSYDQVKATAESAIAQLHAAEAQAAVARNATGYSDLVADADGTVVATLAEPGQVVTAGQAVVRVAHAGAREAVIQLPETLRPRLGSVARATGFGPAATSAQAILRQLSDAADPLTRTFEARYVLNGSLQDAPLGSTVTLNVSDAEASANRGLQIPIGALLDRGKGPGVWVVQGEPATVSWRPVSVLAIDDETARITGVLQHDQQIVALGAHLLHEGEAVRVAGLYSIGQQQGAHP